MIKTSIKVALTVFLLIAQTAYSQSVTANSVATNGGGLLFPEVSSAAPALATSIPLFLDTEPASMPIFPDSDPMGTSLRIISSLFGVILLAFGVSWFIQKKGGLGGNVFGKVVGILPLDNRRMIYIVDIMGRVLILGVTETNINLLGELTDKETLDSLRLQYDQPSPGMEKLFAFLKPGNRATETSEKPETDNKETESGNLHQLRQQDRLKKLNQMLLKRNNPDQPDKEQ
ncbi:MAG TPA: flagellar biosynthetic protein FliO [Candidatus Rifleibacterium sp.]|nr:flagellar biosynthetic protein FliO [Candidatus Rifleibacterium sp.]